MLASVSLSGSVLNARGANAMVMDSTSFDALYSAHSARVYTTAYRILRDRDAAADITQDTFLKALGQSDELRNPGAWLATVATNGSLNYLRRVSRQVTLAEDAQDDDEGGAVLASDEDPLRSASAANQIELLGALLGELKPDYRAALIARYLDELDIERIAAAIGKTVNATTVLLSRARAALRERYAARVFARSSLPADCRARRGDILAIDSGAQVPDEARRHISGCHHCQESLTELRTMSRAFAGLLVPAPAALYPSLVANATASGVLVSGGVATGSAGAAAAGGQTSTAVTATAITGVPASAVAVGVGSLAIVGAIITGLVLLTAAPTMPAAEAVALGDWPAASHLQLAPTADADGVVAAWVADRVVGEAPLLAAVRGADGEWTRPTVLATVVASESVSAPQLVAAPGQPPCVVYVARDEAAAQHLFERCLGDGRWSEPRLVRQGGLQSHQFGVAATSSGPPVVILDDDVSASAGLYPVVDGDGRLHVISVGDGSQGVGADPRANERVFHRHSGDGGTTWSAPEEIGEAAEARHYAVRVVVAQGNTVDVVWVGDGLTARRWEESPGWLPQARVPGSGRFEPWFGMVSSFSAAAMPDGQLHVAYALDDGIYLATRDLTGSWKNAKRVVELDELAGAVALTVSANSALVLAYEAGGTVYGGKQLAP
jgi:RNA polymerase sigma-70 factor (ECF subfamily)